jgi:F-type H+-transporting ATPase subunit alpha
MATKGQDIVSVIKQQIQNFGMTVNMTDVGTVIEVGDGIARMHGLSGCKYNEMLEFPNKVMGVAMNLEVDSVSAIIMGDYSKIKEGDEVKTTGLNW